MAQLDRAQGRHRVDHEKGWMAGPIDCRPYAGNVARHTGGRLVVGYENRLDLVMLESPPRCSSMKSGVDRSPPIPRQNVDREPHRRGPRPPQVAQKWPLS